MENSLSFPHSNTTNNNNYYLSLETKRIRLSGKTITPQTTETSK